MNDLLTEARLRAALGARPFRFEMQVGSTNDIARDWALNGASSGSVVLTEEQVAGRGRFGRKWSAPPGTALLMSVILRPHIQPEYITRLTMVGAVAVAEVITTLTPNPSPSGRGEQGTHEDVRPTSLNVGESSLTSSSSLFAARGGEVLPLALKWPNDVLLAGRKVCGILPEAIWQGDTLTAVILGIGLNIRVDFTGTGLEERSTSLEAFTGGSIDRADLLARLLDRIDYWAMRVTDADLLAAWRSRLVTVGQRVTAQSATGTISGLAIDVDMLGGLVLQAEDGTIHHVVAGEVTLSESGR